MAEAGGRGRGEGAEAEGRRVRVCVVAERAGWVKVGIKAGG